MIHAREPHFSVALRGSLFRPPAEPPSSCLLTRGFTDQTLDRVPWRCIGVLCLGLPCAVRDTSADKLSARALPCVFLSFPVGSSDYTFYHPPLHQFLDSCNVTFDESMSYYARYPCRGLLVPPPPLFLAPSPPPTLAPPVHPATTGLTPSGAGGSSCEGAVAEGVGAGGANSEGAGGEGAGTGGASFGGARAEGAGTGSAIFGSARSGDTSFEESGAGGTATVVPTPPTHRYPTSFQRLSQLERKERERLEQERLELERQRQEVQQQQHQQLQQQQ
ncbi:unnamed protein product [Closterium sp. NIES-53]